MSEPTLPTNAEPPQAPLRSRSMLVLGDLHIGEGKRNWDGSFNVLEDFTVDSKFVEFLDFYSKAYDEVELVLNGNFFEMLRCRAVVDYPDIIFESYAVEMVRVAVAGHSEVFRALRRFMESPHHTIVYLMGEADAGMLWSKVQDELKSSISDRIRFMPSYYFKDGIYIEHGHQYEAMHSFDLNEPFRTVEGLQVLKLPWSAFFNAHFIQPLRKLRPQFYRVRPMSYYLKWAFFFELRFLFRVIAQFVRMIFSARSRHLYPGHSLGTIFRVLSQPPATEVLEECAEILLGNEATHKVIFGHSHIANYRQFQDGKEYFNVGTWTRNLSLDLRSLGSFHRLTYVLVEFRPQGEPQAKLMEWFGRHEVIEDFV